MSFAIELISTGSELLDGRSLNRHAQLLSDALDPYGFYLTRNTVVPDDLDAIADVLKSTLERVDIVFMGGGLGPTSDDLTRNAVAKILDRKIVMDEKSRQAIRRRYAARKKEINPVVEDHALVVEGAHVLSNSAGLAPGERIEVGAKVIFLLPGPPHEFLAVLNDHILPWLKTNRKDVKPRLVRYFEVSGLGESDIISHLLPAGFPDPGVDVAYCAKLGRVEIKLTADERHRSSLEKTATTARKILGHHIYAEERVGLDEVAGRLLQDRKMTLATAESCTGGLIGHRITSISGSSLYYLGGIVAYSNDVKIRELNVRADDLNHYGAVSAEVAREMAIGVREKFKADFGLSVTGIAGPTGATSGKPVGLVYMAVADDAGCETREHRFSGERDAIKDWSANAALDLLRRRLTQTS